MHIEILHQSSWHKVFIIYQNKPYEMIIVYHGQQFLQNMSTLHEILVEYEDDEVVE